MDETARRFQFDGVSLDAPIYDQEAAARTGSLGWASPLPSMCERRRLLAGTAITFERMFAPEIADSTVKVVLGKHARSLRLSMMRGPQGSASS